MTDETRPFQTVDKAAEQLQTSRGSIYRWLRDTDEKTVPRLTMRLPSGNRMVPKLVVHVPALQRYADSLTMGPTRTN